MIVKVTYGHDIDKAKYDYVELITEADKRVVFEGPAGTTIFDILPTRKSLSQLDDAHIQDWHCFPVSSIRPTLASMATNPFARCEAKEDTERRHWGPIQSSSRRKSELVIN